MPQPPRPDQPRAFLAGPAYHAPPQLARLVEVPAPLLLPRLPPPEARLTVRPQPRRPDCAQSFDLVTLAKPLLLAVPHLRAGGAVDLVPPMRRGGPWYLDTRSSASRRLPARLGAVARFRVPALSQEHYLAAGVDARPGRFGGALGTVGTRKSLCFRLGSEMPGHAGYYELLPVG